MDSAVSATSTSRFCDLLFPKDGCFSARDVDAQDLFKTVRSFDQSPHELAETRSVVLVGQSELAEGLEITLEITNVKKRFARSKLHAHHLSPLGNQGSYGIG